MSLEKELMEIKDKLTRLTQKRDQVQGGLDQLAQTMKEQFGVSSAEEAQKKIQLWGEEIEKLEGELQEHVENIKETYQDLLSM